ncbi:hypothetical protein BH11ACT8_BH11ACT8_23020 [soil metagenome]
MSRTSGSARLAGAAAAVALLAGCGLSTPTYSSPDFARTQETPAGAAGATTSASTSYPATAEDLATIQDLMDARAAALLDGDRAAFLATVDDRDGDLVAEQTQLFENVQLLPVTRISYDVEPHGLTPEPVSSGDPAARPPVYEHLLLDGVLRKPIGNELGITFVLRDGEWLVGHESVGVVSFPQDRPWFGGPIAVSDVGDLVVLTDAGATTDGATVGASVHDDLDFVGSSLDRKVDDRLLIDATSNGTPTQLSNASGEDAAAVTMPLFSTNKDNDVTGLAGTAIKVNPDLVADLVDDPVLMRHELTHAALQRSGGTPTWMSEGIAEYVANLPRSVVDDLPAYVAYGIDLSDRGRALVSTGIWGNEPTEDYLIARACVEYLVDRYGMPRYLRLMDYVTKLQATDSPDATDQALRTIFGESAVSVGRGGYALLGY